MKTFGKLTLVYKKLYVFTLQALSSPSIPLDVLQSVRSFHRFPSRRPRAAYFISSRLISSRQLSCLDVTVLQIITLALSTVGCFRLLSLHEWTVFLGYVNIEHVIFDSGYEYFCQASDSGTIETSAI
jgi:hypothetical protein